VSRPAVHALVVSRDLHGMLAHCLGCLAGAFESAAVDGAAVVVDNGSTQPYREEELEGPSLPVHVVRFDRHQSFARCNNAAASRHPASRYLLLNNDVFLHPQAVASMLRLTERTPGAAICGARLLFPDGSIQHCGVVFGPGEKGPYHVHRRRPAHLVPRTERECQAVSGACMLVDGGLWDELGGLDESYPFGLEDIDFCLRARRAGRRIMCSNEVDSLHLESMTPGRVELDVPSRRLFMVRWGGRYAVDG